MAERRFRDSVCSAEKFILEDSSKNFSRCPIASKLLSLKNEERKIEQIPAVELNELILVHNLRSQEGWQGLRTNFVPKFNGQLFPTSK